VIAALDEHHVQPDLAEASERDEPDCWIVHDVKSILSAYGRHGSTRPGASRILRTGEIPPALRGFAREG
jgi:hypothetical protein